MIVPANLTMIINRISLLKRREGFSLAEAMLAMVILSIAAAGVLLPFSSGATVRAEGMHSTLAARLAGDLMEQIINTPFDNIITDYGTYSEAQGHIISDFPSHTPFSDPMYANFSRSASSKYVYVSQESGATEAVFILVTVQVDYSGRKIASIYRLITK
jgi:prepilin-type N-terminal cleavage/methylation domain-containing protein